RGPGLKNEDGPRQARPPAGEHTSERSSHSLPAGGCFPVHGLLLGIRTFTSAPGLVGRDFVYGHVEPPRDSHVHQRPRRGRSRTANAPRPAGADNCMGYLPGSVPAGAARFGGRIVRRTVVHTPRHWETGRLRAAQFAPWAVYILGCIYWGGGATW